MSNEITTYLKYAHLQIAAEALYDLKESPPETRFENAILERMLTTGNDRTSRFTTTDAEWFTKTWTVVEHISNTTTGFSGTLFRALKDDSVRGIAAGELVLSFRSTEFADDAVRDNQATNTLEVKDKGWAFGQIADMEDWFAKLKTSGKLDPGAAMRIHATPTITPRPACTAVNCHCVSSSSSRTLTSSTSVIDMTSP